jgi:hypothetical protein
MGIKPRSTLKRDHWYRSPLWDEFHQSLFNSKIARARAGYSRAQYFRLKAGALFYRGEQASAVELLGRGVIESGAEGSDLAQILIKKGEYEFILSLPEAQRSLRQAVEICPLRKRTFHGTVEPEELLARLAAKQGRFADARKLLDLVYTGSKAPLSYAKFEQQVVTSVDERPYLDPEQAAENIVVFYHAGEDNEPSVPEVFAANRDSLVALDRHFAQTRSLSPDRPFHPRHHFQPGFLQTQLLPGLGAYLGRVLVKAGGQWRIDSPLCRSRVTFNAQVCNPFKAAYDCVYFEVPLTYSYDQVTS